MQQQKKTCDKRLYTVSEPMNIGPVTCKQQTPLIVKGDE